MRAELAEEEVRVLGALVEKSLTTPEYYPMSLNALVAACNQKSSRDPVVSYDEAAVQTALEGLRDKHLVWFVDAAGSRVRKYKHRFQEAFDLSGAEAAALCVLMLRGPQTAGEVRGRSERLHAFADLAEAEAVLEELGTSEEGPLAVKLPRLPGRKEIRYAHALCGKPQGFEEPAPSLFPQKSPLEERVETLEGQVAVLREDLETLKAGLDALRKQLE
jgi:hypothetical protein